MKALKTVITALAIAVFAVHFTAAPALAEHDAPPGVLSEPDLPENRANTLPWGIFSFVDCQDEPTPLHKAIDAGDVEEAHKQIAAGNGQYVNVIARYSDFDIPYCYTPLHRAAQRNDVGREFVDALLKAGADVNTKDNFGWTPLHRAAVNVNTEIAQALIAAGADVNAKNNYDRDPLHATITYGHAETALALIAAGADVNTKNYDGRTPLHYAALEEQKKIAKSLIAAGADVNAKDNYGETPLYYAVTNDQWREREIAKALFAAGARSNRVIVDTSSRLDFSIAEEPEETLDYVEVCPAEQTPLHKAIDAGDFEEARKHMEWRYMNVIARYEEGDRIVDCATPLKRAIKRSDAEREFIDALIKSGAALNGDAKDSLSGTPLYFAAENGNTEIVQVLIAAGADVEAIDDTLFQWAARKGNTEIVQLLITAGANVDAGARVRNDYGGWTPLHYAAYNGDTVIAKSLLKAGAKVDIPTFYSSNTPLDLALQEGNTETADVIRKAGGKCNKSC